MTHKPLGPRPRPNEFGIWAGLNSRLSSGGMAGAGLCSPTAIFSYCPWLGKVCILEANRQATW
ncbi:hypothetical protein PG996_015982 [Apiospora saccharicola]|uniref:Uncharacterized protein n=1 Tax=Apiospora saccharicola TaxID=335842 RepID=A0ABR1TMS8_9PEZI